MMGLRRRQHGFTIVELMVATLTFSVILLLCATAIVQVGRMYYKGIITNRTEDTSRRAMDDISQSIQFGARGAAASFLRPGADLAAAPPRRAWCLGGIRYTYATRDYALGTLYSLAQGTSKHVLWKDRIATTATCTPVDLNLDTPSSGGVELLDEHMRVTDFTISHNTISDLWTVHLVVSYGDGTSTNPDVFTDNTYTACVNRNSGGQFCAISELNTSIIKRL